MAQDLLPTEYMQFSSAECRERIAHRKEQLGLRVAILAHHYQSDEVFAFADLTGDSLKLSRLAAEQKEAEFIVFCGVHFMAESAAVLAGEHQAVVLPNLLAGCNMADMAEAGDVEAALEELRRETSVRVIPIAYVNTTAAVKAAVGRAGGACCTSSNVANVFRWALAPRDRGGAGAEKILCVPDQHLGRNTACTLGYKESDCAVYDPALAGGGLTAAATAKATFVLWKGHCYVHQLFRPEHVAKVRREHPGIRVIVHPECPRPVVQLADMSGSTEQIIHAVSTAQPGSRWAVGTESTLVRRLARQHTDRFVCVLSESTAVCAMMQRTDLPHLLWVLDSLSAGQVVNRVTVPPEVAEASRLSLDRMLAARPVIEAAKREGSRQ
jgi:quinolinate synthase